DSLVFQRIRIIDGTVAHAMIRRALQRSPQYIDHEPDGVLRRTGRDPGSEYYHVGPVEHRREEPGTVPVQRVDRCARRGVYLHRLRNPLVRIAAESRRWIVDEVDREYLASILLQLEQPPSILIHFAAGCDESNPVPAPRLRCRVDVRRPGFDPPPLESKRIDCDNPHPRGGRVDIRGLSEGMAPISEDDHEEVQLRIDPD